VQDGKKKQIWNTGLGHSGGVDGPTQEKNQHMVDKSNPFQIRKHSFHRAGL
jgi:hypothetical protein